MSKPQDLDTCELVAFAFIALVLLGAILSVACPTEGPVEVKEVAGEQ